MKTPHAKWLTVHKSDIDPYTSIEILWKTEPNTLHLLVFRISLGGSGSRPRLATEEIGPYHCLVELHQQLCLLFGKLAAQRICQPSSWLPASIPATPKAGQAHDVLPPRALDRDGVKPRMRGDSVKGHDRSWLLARYTRSPQSQRSKRDASELLPPGGGRSRLGIRQTKNRRTEKVELASDNQLPHDPDAA